MVNLDDLLKEQFPDWTREELDLAIAEGEEGESVDGAAFMEELIAKARARVGAEGEAKTVL